MAHRQLSDLTKVNVAKHFVDIEECQTLAVHLGMSLGDVERLRAKLSPEMSVERLATKILDLWTQRESRAATGKVLHAVLREMNRKDIADKLASWLLEGNCQRKFQSAIMIIPHTARSLYFLLRQVSTWDEPNQWTRGPPCHSAIEAIQIGVGLLLFICYFKIGAFQNIRMRLIGVGWGWGFPKYIRIHSAAFIFSLRTVLTWEAFPLKKITLSLQLLFLITLATQQELTLKQDFLYHCCYYSLLKPEKPVLAASLDESTPSSSSSTPQKAPQVSVKNGKLPLTLQVP